MQPLGTVDTSFLLAENGIRVPFVGPDNRKGARAVGDYLAGHLQPGQNTFEPGRDWATSQSCTVRPAGAGRTGPAGCV